MNARDRVASLTSSFDEQDVGLATTDPLSFEGYRVQMDEARSDTGLDEACIWGWADVSGAPCALVVFDFRFMGGSMGMVVGEKVARAFDAARRARKPVVTVTASGGARMQEGMWSLVQMAKTVEARRRHADAGLLHITLLTSPTTGGVYASFASLADIIFAESGATVGFAGPRVVQHLTGQTPPPGVHRAEFALAHGFVDAIVDPGGAASAIAAALSIAAAPPASKSKRDAAPTPYAQRSGAGASAGASPVAPAGAWERLQRVRAGSRLRGPQILDDLLSAGVELHGDRSGAADDRSVVVRIGSLRDGGRTVVAIAQDADTRIEPQGFRKAIRAIELAGRLGHPVLTLIDTRGADPLPASEALGVAPAIAATFDAMLACPSPTLSVICGEGGSGGALAMAVADRVIASENAVFSVIAPEGAAAILYRDAGRAPELAERLRIGTEDLTELGVVDVVVPEDPAGVDGIAKAQVNVQMLSSVVASELDRLAEARRPRRLAARHRRWRQGARPSPRPSPRPSRRRPRGR